MISSQPTSASSAPSTSNALIGAAGIGARVMASAALGAAAAARAAARPAAAAARSGLATTPGRAVRAEALSIFESLDAAGRKDVAGARAELDAALDRAVDRLITDTLSSQRAKRAIERVLESEELWRLVDRIANSPEVLSAIAGASAGLTGVVADEARKRSVTADEFAERIARRVLRRPPRGSKTLVIEPPSAEGPARQS